MAEENATTIEEKTYTESLTDSILGAFLPLDCLISFSNRDFGPDNEMNDFHPILNVVCASVKDSITRLYECVEEHIGKIEIRGLNYHESLKINDKWYNYPDLVDAFIESPVNRPASRKK